MQNFTDYFLRYSADVPDDEVSSHQKFSRDCRCKPKVTFNSSNGWHTLVHQSFEKQLGSTGRFPNGRINEKDNGEILISIEANTNKQTVLINFGIPVTWIGMSADQADGLAKELIEKARMLRASQN